ncbi:MAG: WxL domain-containing protein [Chloroflexota bacterium]|nr:WxL domain-containing protein [Chloroflexota bacterium]
MRSVLTVLGTVLGAIALLLASAVSAYAVSGGPMTAVLTAGALSLTGAVPGSFVATLTGASQTVDAALTTYQAVDARGTATGWHVTFSATTFACANPTDAGCPAGGSTFPTSSLTMPAPTVTCVALCTGIAAPPTISIVALTALDSGSAVTVASAATNTGAGTYNFAPGTVGTGNLQLAVPSNAYATTYHSTLTVSIVAGP